MKFLFFVGRRGPQRWNEVRVGVEIVRLDVEALSRRACPASERVPIYSIHYSCTSVPTPRLWKLVALKIQNCSKPSDELGDAPSDSTMDGWRMGWTRTNNQSIADVSDIASK